MPVPPAQPNEARTRTNGRSLKKISKRPQTDAQPVMKFLIRELKHWQTDLQRKQQEGEHFLEWLNWKAADPMESVVDQNLQSLVSEEIPALAKMIFNLSASAGNLDVDQLLLAQHAYGEFCKRYDQIKLRLLAEMEWGRNFRIF